MKTIRSLPLLTENCQVVSKEGIVSLFDLMGDLPVHAWFGVVETLTVDMLPGRSLIDCCVQGMFLSKRKIVPQNSLPLVTLSTQKAVNAIATNTKELEVYGIPHCSTPTEEHYFCHVALQVTITAYFRGAVLAIYHCGGLIAVENHPNVVEHRCSMTVQGLINTLHGKHLHLYTANLTAKAK